MESTTARQKLIKRKTCHRYNHSGHAHALTFSCFGGQPFLDRDRTRQWMLHAIKPAQMEHALDIWAFVIMPEHVHLLFHPRETRYDVSRILTTLKQSVAKRAMHFVKASAPSFLPRMTDKHPNGKTTIRFWQRGGGYDRNLWSPGYIWETIEYIHDNPVRRGLCNRPEDWPWSSAVDYSASRSGLIPIAFESLPADPRVKR